MKTKTVKKHQKEMTTLIKDCIYKLITVSDICLRFIDTFEFQRLRNIKQLGFVHYVYPSAVHTRFEHSLGVMHLAGVMVDNLRHTGVEITDREKDLVQIAGLLHDVGHLSSSHLIDYILEEADVKSTHEDRSVAILYVINDRLHLLDAEETVAVDCMIHGVQFDSVMRMKKPFLFEIVSNSVSGLDVDRFDYLQRDAYHTGISGFQPEYLMRCARVQDGHIVYLRKAYSEVVLLYEVRRRMFALVYRHKTVLMIEQVIRNCIAKMGIVEKWNNKMEMWLNLDDIELMSSLKKMPEFVETYTRSWERKEIENKFEHCSSITDEDIAKKIAAVTFL